MDSSIKKMLFAHCLHEAEERIARIRQVIQTAQEAANEEDKNSAGDKYETGRAMMHLEQEKNMVQLNEALKLKEVMLNLKADTFADTIIPGSLIFTDLGNFYISISLGNIELEKQTYIAISASSPLGKALLGLKKGDHCLFMQKKYTILKVC